MSERAPEPEQALPQPGQITPDQLEWEYYVPATEGTEQAEPIALPEAQPAVVTETAPEEHKPKHLADGPTPDVPRPRRHRRASADTTTVGTGSGYMNAQGEDISSQHEQPEEPQQTRRQRREAERSAEGDSPIFDAILAERVAEEDQSGTSSRQGRHAAENSSDSQDDQVQAPLTRRAQLEARREAERIAAGLSPEDAVALREQDRQDDQLYYATDVSRGTNRHSVRQGAAEAEQSASDTTESGESEQQEPDVMAALLAVYLARGGSQEQWDGFSAEDRQRMLDQNLAQAKEGFLAMDGNSEEGWNGLSDVERLRFLPDQVNVPPVAPEDVNQGGRGRWAKVKAWASRQRAAVYAFAHNPAEFVRGMEPRKRGAAIAVGALAVAAVGVGLYLAAKNGHDTNDVTKHVGDALPHGDAAATPEAIPQGHIYELTSGQNPWSVTADHLRSLGVENPTDAQIWTVDQEVARLSGIDIAGGQDRRLPVGFELSMPPDEWIKRMLGL